MTFFVINDASLQAMQHVTPSSQLSFQDTGQGYWTTQRDNPEAAIAFAEQDVVAMYVQAGLEIQFPIRYGNWSGREGSIGGQDHVLAIKR